MCCVNILLVHTTVSRQLTTSCDSSSSVYYLPLKTPTAASAPMMSCHRHVDQTIDTGTPEIGTASDVKKDCTCKDKDKDQAYKDQDKDKD